MAHHLWEQGRSEWVLAKDEDIIAALLDAPMHPDPGFMGYCRSARSHCIVQMQQIFYGGSIPPSVSRIRRRSLGV